MSEIPAVSFAHIGIHVRDLECMERFYTGLLGFLVTDRGDLGAARLVFLSRDAGEHHQIALVSGRTGDEGQSVLNQISLRVADLAALKYFHARAPAHGAHDIHAVTHGNAVSVYFRDPEGNRIELYLDTPWYVTQPIRIPVDLAKPDAEIWRDIEVIARAQPGFRPIGEWRMAMQARLTGR